MLRRQNEFRLESDVPMAVRKPTPPPFPSSRTSAPQTEVRNRKHRNTACPGTSSLHRIRLICSAPAAVHPACLASCVAHGVSHACVTTASTAASPRPRRGSTTMLWPKSWLQPCRCHLQEHGSDDTLRTGSCRRRQPAARRVPPSLIWSICVISAAFTHTIA